MLEETNKFREHQSRELLIELLEKQLHERQKLVRELEHKVAQADTLLSEEPTALDTQHTAEAMDES